MKQFQKNAGQKSVFLNEACEGNFIGAGGMRM
jgi:hypothetical protein